jgi:hypothetical protein
VKESDVGTAGATRRTAKKRRKKEHEILTELLVNFIYNIVSSLALSLSSPFFLTQVRQCLVEAKAFKKILDT